ncbi:hypothetical protein Hanom_Chr00s106364g01806041 [Helianthus anomalus]
MTYSYSSTSPPSFIYYTYLQYRVAYKTENVKMHLNLQSNHHQFVSRSQS